MLVTEDKAVIFGYCFLRGVALVGKEDELLKQLHAVTLTFEF